MKEKVGVTGIRNSLRRPGWNGNRVAQANFERVLGADLHQTAALTDDIPFFYAESVKPGCRAGRNPALCERHVGNGRIIQEFRDKAVLAGLDLLADAASDKGFTHCCA